MPFSALGLGANIVKALGEAGYTEPTPIQAAAIPEIIAGHDLIGIAQTGTGKTAAFVLPVLTKLAGVTGGGNKPATRVLVLAPTRELAAQIEENVRAYAKHLPIRIATVFGGVGERPQIEALRAKVEFIIATPGRLLDLMNSKHGDFTNLQYLVLDEADRMLDMGFLPDMRRIVRALPKKRQTLLFSATLSKEIEALTHEFLTHPKTVQIGRRSNPAETVTQMVYEVEKSLKPKLLLHLLRDPEMNMVLVFSRTKHGADRIARMLEREGVKSATLHSNRSQNQRLRALREFKAGTVRVLVATDIAARGIDVDGISHVINYDLPMQAEDYVHRIGRTGRAQQIGDAISFVSGEERSALKALERFIGRGITRKHAEGFANAPAPVEASASQARPENRRQASSAGRPSRQNAPKPQRERPSHGPASAAKPKSGGPQKRHSRDDRPAESRGSFSSRKPGQFRGGRPQRDGGAPKSRPTR